MPTTPSLLELLVGELRLRLNNRDESLCNAVACLPGDIFCLLFSQLQRDSQSCTLDVLLRLRDNMTSLRVVDFSALPSHVVTDDWLAELCPYWSSVTSLDLSTCRKLHSVEPVFQHMPGLTSLNLSKCKFVDAASCRGISQLTQLQELNLSMNMISNSTLAELAELHQLRKLKVANPQLFSGLKQICNARPPLRVLDVHSCAFEEDELQSLGNLAPTLTDLNASFLVNATAAGLANVGQLHLLRRLNLGVVLGCDDSVLEQVGRLVNLEVLSVQRTSITDDGLRHLGNLHNLTELDLGKNHQLTDAGLTHLIQLRHLRNLRLQYVSVTDAFFERALMPEVQGIKQEPFGERLQELTVHSCSALTPYALSLMAQHMPALRELSFGGQQSGALVNTSHFPILHKFDNKLHQLQLWETSIRVDEMNAFLEGHPRFKLDPRMHSSRGNFILVPHAFSGHTTTGTTQ